MEFRRFLRTEIVERSGTSLLFASHMLPEVDLLADRVAIIDRGRLLACDTPSALRRRTIARTYRAPFVLEAIEALFGAAMFYYMARFVDSPELRQALPPGTSYFVFALVGWIFFEYLHTAIDTFDQSILEARDAGTLEQLLITQTSLPVMLAGSALYPFAAALLRVAVYVAWGTVLFGFPLRAANWTAIVMVLVATLLAFSGLGILSASYVLLFKRGNPAKWLLLSFSNVVGGMLFPISILPDWLQFAARLNPVTYALDAMRAALAGASLATVWRPVAVLLLMAAVLLPSSMAVFSCALRRTKVTGTLTHS
jgi:ABC-2 type transport system permease protein